MPFWKLLGTSATLVVTGALLVVTVPIQRSERRDGRLSNWDPSDVGSSRCGDVWLRRIQYDPMGPKPEEDHGTSADDFGDTGLFYHCFSEVFVEFFLGALGRLKRSLEPYDQQLRSKYVPMVSLAKALGDLRASCSLASFTLINPCHAPSKKGQTEE